MNGATKPGQDVQVGDVLLGLSNEPRRVAELIPYEHPTVPGAVALAKDATGWGIMLWRDQPVRVA